MNLKIKDKIKIFFRNILVKTAKFFIRGYNLSRFAPLQKMFNSMYSLVFIKYINKI